MRALFTKELQELTGLFGFAAFAWVLLTAAHLSVHLPLYTTTEAVRYLIEDQLILFCLAAFAAGHGRFGHELEQGTLGFLEGLPISRPRIFLVKAAAVGVSTAVLWLVLVGVKGLTLSIFPQPNALSLVPMLAALGLQAGVLLFAHAATGMALSWFGRVAWQALLVGGLTLLIAQVILPWLNPYYPLFQGGIGVDLSSGWPTFPLGPVVLWWVWGTAALALSFGLFLGPGDPIVTGQGWVKAIAQVLIFGPVVLGLLVLVGLSVVGTAVNLPTFFQRTQRVETEHFRFLYAQDDRATAQALIDQSEGIRLAIAAAFDHEGPERLDIEMTGASEHLQGVFVPGKIQLRPDADGATLAHELAHAWSHSSTSGALDGLPRWGFYEEGVASEMESLGGSSSTQAQRPDRNSPASDWFLIPVPGRHDEQFNPDDKYPLGMAWVEAILQLGGPDARLCVHRAAAATPTDGLDSIPWWTEVLGQCDLDMAEFVAAFRDRLPESTRSSAHAPYGVVTDDGDGQIGVLPMVDSDSTRLLCTARGDESTPRTQYSTAFATAGNPCVLSTFMLPVDTFQLMVGERTDDGSQAMGPWRTVRREDLPAVTPSAPPQPPQ